KTFEGLKARGVEGFKDFESDPGEFGGMRLSRIAQELLERKGVSTPSMSDDKIVGTALVARAPGFSSESDFAVLLENVMYKSLLGQYALAPDTWRRWCKVDTTQDFRPSNRYRIGSFGVLDSVPEGAEFKSKEIPDGLKQPITVA